MTESEENQDPQSFEYVNLVLYGLLFVLIGLAMCRQFYHRGFERPWATQQIFHLYLFIFITCRLIWSAVWFGDVDNEANQFFFGRNALYFFSLSFLVVIFFLSVEVMGASRKLQRISWITLWCLTGVVFCFVLSGTIFYSQKPEEFEPEEPLYEVSIHLATALSLLSAIGMCIAGFVVAYRLKKTDQTVSKGPRSNRTFRNAFYLMIVVTVVTVIFMLLRFIIFLYRPVTGELLNDWVFMSLGYWGPESILSFFYLYVMRGVQNHQTQSTFTNTSASGASRAMERTTLTKGVGGDEVGDEEKGDLEMQEFALEESPICLPPLPPPASASLPEEEFFLTGEVELCVSLTLAGKDKEKYDISPVVGLFTEKPNETINSRASRRKTRFQEGGLDKSAFLRDEIVERGGNIDESLVQNLLETGADILSVDEEGQNALHLACRWSPYNIISLLLQKASHNATTVATPDSYFFPLHLFCGRDFRDVNEHKQEVEHILVSLIKLPEGKEKEKEEEGGKGKGKEVKQYSLINVPSATGETALHRACQCSGDQFIISLLLKYGADPSAITKQGITPSKMAIFARRPEVVPLLKKSNKESSPYPAHLKMKKEVGEKKERKPMVETLYYSSYIERSDRDRTEVIFQSPPQSIFFRTLCLRAQRIERPLYFGVFSIDDDPDNLAASQYIGDSHFTLKKLSQKGGLQTLNIENYGCLNISLENIEQAHQLATTISKGYIFPTVQGNCIRVREELEESRYSFLVPSLLLSLIFREREAQCHVLDEFVTNFEAKKNFYTSRDATGDLFDGHLQEMKVKNEDEALLERIKLMAEEHQHHLEHIMEATKLYTSYHKSYDDLSFKPSTYKGDIPLAFIPTNLHHQKMKVYPRVQLPFTYSEDRLGLMNGKVESTKTKGTEVEGHEGEYHITTFGAPAAHTMKFKSGGLRHVEEKFLEKKKHLTSYLKGKKESDSIKSFLLNLDAFEAQMQLIRRRDICFCQILPAIITNFMRFLELNQSKPSVLQQYADVGFLCQFESLVSTHGSEIGMLADYDGAVRGIASRVSFVLVGENEKFSLEFVQKEMKREENNNHLFGPDNFLKIQNTVYDSCSLLITLPLPDQLYNNVSILHQEKIAVYPLLFSQGINEQQSIAIKFGDTSLQEKMGYCYNNMRKNMKNGVMKTIFL